MNRVPMRLVVAAALALGGVGSALAIDRGGDAHASANDSTTYREQGVIVHAPTARARAEAARSVLRTASAAVAEAKRSHAWGGLFGSGRATASLRTVTDLLPITKGVSARVPYEAWVVTAPGTAIFMGGPGSAPPPAGTRCTNVAIYDLDIAKWTEALQNC